MAAQRDIAYCTTRRLSKVLELQYSESVYSIFLHTIAIIEDFKENYSSHPLKETELIEALYIHVHTCTIQNFIIKLVNWT